MKNSTLVKNRWRSIKSCASNHQERFCGNQFSFKCCLIHTHDKQYVVVGRCYLVMMTLKPMYVGETYE